MEKKNETQKNLINRFFFFVLGQMAATANHTQYTM